MTAHGPVPPERAEEAQEARARAADPMAVFTLAAQRPGMLGLDGSYAGFCAFIGGYDAATGFALLDGFSPWLAQRCGGGWNIVWQVLALEAAVPGVEARFPRFAMDAADTSRAISGLLTLLGEFRGWESPETGPG